MVCTRLTSMVLALTVSMFTFPMGVAQSIRLATFAVDVTPPVGSPLCDGLVVPTASVDDPLEAKGIVLLSSQKPVVLIAFDWVGIGNAGYDRMREVVAQAVDTTPDRVAIHSLHQHDAPGLDFEADEIASMVGLRGVCCDREFGNLVMDRLAQAAKASLDKATPITHVGHGKAKIEKVASARRVLGPDGKVKYTRTSATKSAEAREQPEGVIDPYVQILSFWNEDKAVAMMSYYATHPMSYYGKGQVSADFIGLARRAHEQQSHVFQVHFNGGGGNVTAGKYNDGDPANRALLTERVRQGMEKAWQATTKVAIQDRDLDWKTVPVKLPLSPQYQDEAAIQKQLQDDKLPPGRRVQFARHLAFAKRMQSGHEILIQRLRLGSIQVLHMPGELFVEYQLAAQEMKPNVPILMAAYGDYGPGYIGMSWSYPQGGYETGPVSRVAPEVEEVLMSAMRRLLND